MVVIDGKTAFIGGSTGESNSLNLDERRQLAQRIARIGEVDEMLEEIERGYRDGGAG